MGHFLNLSIRFLDPVPSFHGRGDGGTPEWPPSPLRVFQALLRAAAVKWHTIDIFQPVLRCLEKQQPQILAPLVRAQRTPYRMYVPNNAADLVAAAWARGSDASIAEHRIEKEVRPSRLIDGDTIHYLFMLPAELIEHFNMIRSTARSITHLGWGIDMVAADASLINEEEIGKLPGERWIADSTGGTRLRVPIDRTLEALMKRHYAFLNRLGHDGFHPVPPLAAFRLVGYRRAHEPIPRPFADVNLGNQ